MRADVQGRVDSLRNDSDRLQILRIVHLVAGVTDPAGRMHVHDVGKIDDFHQMVLRPDVDRANRSQKPTQCQMATE